MKRLRETLSKTPYPKLLSYAYHIYGPAVKGSLLSTLPAAVSLFVIPLMAVRSLLGAESFQSEWDPPQLTDTQAIQVLYGRKGLLLFALGGSFCLTSLLNALCDFSADFDAKVRRRTPRSENNAREGKRWVRTGLPNHKEDQGLSE